MPDSLLAENHTENQTFAQIISKKGKVNNCMACVYVCPQQHHTKKYLLPQLLWQRYRLRQCHKNTAY